MKLSFPAYSSSVFLAVFLPALLSLAARQEPWASDTDPSDVPRTEIVDISFAPAEYTLIQAGTLDGENCRSPIGYGCWYQVWESNRSIRMENIGTNDVINPWLSTGRANFRTLPDIVTAVCPPGMTDREKAIALWNWHRKSRAHFIPALFNYYHYQMYSPLKLVNIYGYDYCEYAAVGLTALWQAAGLTVRWTDVHQHSTREVFFDGRWNLLDSDVHVFFPLRDNATLASEPDLVEDHDLVKRTHHYGTRNYPFGSVLQSPNRIVSEWMAAIHVATNQNPLPTILEHAMDLVLRPGEALVWEWGHILPYKFHGYAPGVPWTDDRLALIANGFGEYQPLLTNSIFLNGVAWITNVVQDGSGLSSAPDQSGTVIWKMASPYVMVGGNLLVSASNAFFQFSYDGQTWFPTTAELDAFFPGDGPAVHAYYLACSLATNGRLNELTIRTDLQMAPLSLPAMRVGNNTFLYTDQTPGSRQVRVTHQWVERSTSQPPLAPPSPVFPPDGAEVEGTRITFEWTPPTDPDSDPITDYHFVLSDRPDIPWPLSPDMEVQTSFTTNAGQPRYTLAYDGMLNPDQEYYWHVRAQDSRGVWGPWSETWRFTPHAPGPPLNVRLDMDAAGNGTLQWQPNPMGRPPAAYRVYGSDEKGFTTSDEPYAVMVSSTSTGTYWATYPANFAAETITTQLVVIGANQTFTNANKAHYRVVAVDSNANQSWSSAQATAPRPLLLGPTNLSSMAGESFSCQYQCLRSWGHFRSLLAWGPIAFAFWDLESPVFSAPNAPDWLSMDATNGILSGTPPSAANRLIPILAEIQGLGIATQILALTVNYSAPPETPTDFTASSDLLTNLIRLAWTHSTQAEYYELRQNQSNDLASAALIGTTTKNVFTNSGLSLNTLYYYWLTARNGLGASEPATLAAFWQTLLPPDNLQATDGTRSDCVRLTWTASDHAAGYAIYRSSLPPSASLEGAASAAPSSSSSGGRGLPPSMNQSDSLPTSSLEGHASAWPSSSSLEGAASACRAEALPRRAAPSSSSSGGRGLPPSMNRNDFTLIAYTTATAFDDPDTDPGVLHSYCVVATNAYGTSEPSATDTGWRTSPMAIGTATRDFDGDRISDLLIYGEASGIWGVLTAQGRVSTFQWGGPGMQPVAGDYVGDQRLDPAVYHEASGTWYIRAGNGTPLAWGIPWGGPGLTPVPGDYDGDRRSDLAVYDRQSGQWFVLTATGNVLAWGLAWGGPGLTPAPGDYDGDGRSDFAVYAEATGLWYILSSQGNVLAWAQHWGGPGMVPVWSDFDADGRSDLAVYDQTHGCWYVCDNTGRVLLWAETAGGPGHTAVPGDYNADSHSDLATYETAAGRWRIRSAGHASFLRDIRFGGPGYSPVP